MQSKHSLMVILGTLCLFVRVAAAENTAEVSTNSTLSAAKDVAEFPARVIEKLDGLEIPEASELILLTIEEIETTDKLSEQDRRARIAQTVGCAVHALGAASPDVFARISPRLSSLRLALVTASAVIAGANFSPELLAALRDGRELPDEQAAISAAALDPEPVLTRDEKRLVMHCTVIPIPVQPLPIRPFNRRGGKFGRGAGIYNPFSKYPPEEYPPGEYPPGEYPPGTGTQPYDGQ